jgi:thioredoxin-like negative regulator of GroEL
MPEFLQRARTFRDVSQALREIADNHSNPDQLAFVCRLADQYEQMAEEEQAKSTLKISST